MPSVVRAILAYRSRYAIYMGPPINIFQYVVILGVTISGQGATHNVYTPNLSQHIVISALYKKKGTLRCSPPASPFERKGPWSWSCFVGPIHCSSLSRNQSWVQFERQRGWLAGGGLVLTFWVSICPQEHVKFGDYHGSRYIYMHTHIYIYTYDKYSYIHMSL